MSNLTIYHGSSEIIKTPEYRKGTVYDDYGQGFYCTEHIELAKEWACTENTDGFVNKGIYYSSLAGTPYEQPKGPAVHPDYEKRGTMAV